MNGPHAPPLREVRCPPRGLIRLGAARRRICRPHAHLVAVALACRQIAAAAANAAKYLAGEAGFEACTRAVMTHGGFGYAEEYSVSRLFVDARVLSIFEGADETLCLKVIARQLVDAAKN